MVFVSTHSYPWDDLVYLATRRYHKNQPEASGSARCSQRRFSASRRGKSKKGLIKWGLVFWAFSQKKRCELCMYVLYIYKYSIMIIISSSIVIMCVVFILFIIIGKSLLAYFHDFTSTC